ncbi:MAG: hypothetical protein OEY86_00790, partial [Nitrospira sp.]|nr:hypothetical protein [Nitrospira sp.]
MKLTVTRGRTGEYEDENRNRFFSVSEHLAILDPFAFSGVPPAVLAAAGMRGEKLHLYFAQMLFHVAGLDGCLWPTRPPGMLGLYFDSMARWVESRKPQPRKVEQKSLNVKIRTAGQPDTECLLDSEVCLIDLKTGLPRPVHSVQLHAYKRLDGYGESKRLFSLYAKKNGEMAQLIEHTHDHSDWSGFMAANAV